MYDDSGMGADVGVDTVGGVGFSGSVARTVLDVVGIGANVGAGGAAGVGAAGFVTVILG